MGLGEGAAAGEADGVAGTDWMLAPWALGLGLGLGLGLEVGAGLELLSCCCGLFWQALQGPLAAARAWTKVLAVALATASATALAEADAVPPGE